MLTGVARDQILQLKIASAYLKIYFWYITIQTMIGPLGKSEFCFPRISMFLSTFVSWDIVIRGCPQDQSLVLNAVVQIISDFLKMQQ